MRSPFLKSHLPECILFVLFAAFAWTGCGGEGSGPGDAGTGGSGGSAGAGLPCEVIAVLQSRCWTCHGASPTPGAPMSLYSYADLTAEARSDPSKTVAEVSVLRMKSSVAPMPPGGGATADEIAAMEGWIAAGTPKGSCDNPGDPFGGGVVCTSSKMWTFGEDVSDAMRPQMHPGQACNQCHQKQPAGDQPPIFLAAGTVFPTGHEPNDCFGIDGSNLTDVIVRVADSEGRVYDLPVGASGNFLLEEGAFVPPYSAEVISSKGKRTMAAKQTSGDCNSCHTEQGGGYGSMAPGRIVVPW